MKIIKGCPEHAGFIASCIMEAVGEDICSNLAGEQHTLTDVHRLFSSLAARQDTQYSYRNALIAVDDNGQPIGAVIGYDGAGLHAMREHFFTAAKEILGIDMGAMEDECDADEFYIDTLAVSPQWRRRGIAAGLLREIIKRAKLMGKPAGLLVDKSNPTARKLYEEIGFRKVGERPFAFVIMDHLQI